MKAFSPLYIQLQNGVFKGNWVEKDGERQMSESAIYSARELNYLHLEVSARLREGRRE